MFTKRNPTETPATISVTTDVVIVPPPEIKVIASLPGSRPPRPEPTLRDASGRPFWPLFLIDGEPVPPWNVTELISSGGASLADLDQSEQHLEAFNHAGGVHGTLDVENEYWRPIAAQHKQNAIEAKRRFDEMFPEGPTVPAVERMMSAREVADVLGISEKTVHRLSGTSLPRHAEIGGQKRWKASAIQKVIDRAGA